MGFIRYRFMPSYLFDYHKTFEPHHVKTVPKITVVVMPIVHHQSHRVFVECPLSAIRVLSVTRWTLIGQSTLDKHLVGCMVV